MAYTTQINRQHPSALVFLVDRSWSMSDPLSDGSGRTKSQGVADVLNKLIYELVLRCIVDHSEGPRHYYDLAIVGYGQSALGEYETVESGFGGHLAGRMLVSIVDVANNPMRIDERPAGADPAAGGVRMPVWIDPVHGFSTPMCGAIETVGPPIAEWIGRHPESFPPIVVNITDGMATDAGSDGAGLAVWAERLRNLRTTDGGLLLFNVYLTSETAHPTFFPTSAAALPAAGQALFEISSELPPLMVEAASQAGIPATAGSRGLVVNADMSSLVQFLRIGTVARPTGV